MAHHVARAGNVLSGKAETPTAACVELFLLKQKIFGNSCAYRLFEWQLEHALKFLFDGTHTSKVEVQQSKLLLLTVSFLFGVQGSPRTHTAWFGHGRVSSHFTDLPTLMAIPDNQTLL